MTPLDSSHLEVFLEFFWKFFIFLNLNLNFEFGPISYRSKAEPVTGYGRFGEPCSSVVNPSTIILFPPGAGEPLRPVAPKKCSVGLGPRAAPVAVQLGVFPDGDGGEKGRRRGRGAAAKARRTGEVNSQQPYARSLLFHCRSLSGRRDRAVSHKLAVDFITKGITCVAEEIVARLLHLGFHQIRA